MVGLGVIKVIVIKNLKITIRIYSIYFYYMDLYCKT